MLEIKKYFDTNGYVIIKNFFNINKINNAVEEYKNIARSFQTQKLGEHFFRGAYDNPQSTDHYFFDSANHVRPFFNSSLNNNRDVLALDLLNENNLFSYLQVMNKVGHNLHGKNNFFHDLFFQDNRLTEIAKLFGYDETCTSLFQTTIISKSLAEDSLYNPHQDGTYIGGGGKVLAYWIPLTSSQIDNGCLWGIPGSHKIPTNFWYRKKTLESFHCHYTGEQPQFDISKKINLEVDAGDILIFSGNFIHGSSPAKISPKNINDLRIALTYHLGPTSNWDDLIWLKLNNENCLRLY